MLFSTKIAQLTEALGAVTAERDQFAASIVDLQAANDAFKAADSDQLEQIRVLTAERDQLLTDKADLTTRFTTLETSIDTQVNERLAAAGVPVVERVDKQNPGDPKPENAVGLTPKQRLAASFNAQTKK